MADTKRVIIASESDDSLKIDLQDLNSGTLTVVPVGIYGSDGTQISNFGGSGHTSVGDFSTVIPTSGTAVQLASNTCKRVVLTAFQTNAGVIAVGGSTVVAADDGLLRGVKMFATQSQEFFVNNTNLLYIDSTSNGDGVSVFFEN